MNKKSVLWIILDLIFLIIFNVIFFVVSENERNASAWISYAFVHFAYFMLLLTPLLIHKSKFPTTLGFPLYSISAIYFLIEFLVGITFILINPESVKATLLIQLCIVGLYGIVLIANMIANEYTADALEKRQHEILYVKNASEKMKRLLENVTDKEIKKAIEKVYDEISSSPVKSNRDLIQIEGRILQSINDLENEILTNNKERVISIASSLLKSVDERNMKLYTLN